MNSRTIVISAVNLTSGGPLTILQECLGYLNSSPLLATYEVIALVHDRKLADFSAYPLHRIAEKQKTLDQSVVLRIRLLSSALASTQTVSVALIARHDSECPGSSKSGIHAQFDHFRFG